MTEVIKVKPARISSSNTRIALNFAASLITHSLHGAEYRFFFSLVLFNSLIFSSIQRMEKMHMSDSPMGVSFSIAQYRSIRDNVCDPV